MSDIDFSIDVRNEKDVIEAFNKFIKKWCGDSYPHLIDSDENDGQFMRDKIIELLEQERKKYLKRELDVQTWIVEQLGGLLEQADSKRNWLEEVLKEK